MAPSAAAPASAAAATPDPISATAANPTSADTTWPPITLRGWANGSALPAAISAMLAASGGNSSGRSGEHRRPRRGSRARPRIVRVESSVDLDAGRGGAADVGHRLFLGRASRTVTGSAVTTCAAGRTCTVVPAADARAPADTGAWRPTRGGAAARSECTGACCGGRAGGPAATADDAPEGAGDGRLGGGAVGPDATTVGDTRAGAGDVGDPAAATAGDGRWGGAGVVGPDGATDGVARAGAGGAGGRDADGLQLSVVRPTTIVAPGAERPMGRPAHTPSTRVPLPEPRSSTVTMPGGPAGGRSRPPCSACVTPRGPSIGRSQSAARPRRWMPGDRRHTCPRSGPSSTCRVPAGGRRGSRPRRSSARSRARPAAVDYPAGRVRLDRRAWSSEVSVGAGRSVRSATRRWCAARSAGDRPAERCSVDLPGEGARKALGEGHRTRPKRLGESDGRVVEQLLRERRTGHRRGTGDDDGVRDVAADRIRQRDHRGLQHPGVGGEDRLQLERRDPLVEGLEHVVAAAEQPYPAVVVALGQIAGRLARGSLGAGTRGATGARTRARGSRAWRRPVDSVRSMQISPDPDARARPDIVLDRTRRLAGLAQHQPVSGQHPAQPAPRGPLPGRGPDHGGRLGLPVAVPRPDSPLLLDPVGDRRVEDLPGAGRLAQRRTRGVQERQHRLPGAGRGAEAGDPVPFQQRGQLLRRAPGPSRAPRSSPRRSTARTGCSRSAWPSRARTR